MESLNIYLQIAAKEGTTVTIEDVLATKAAMKPTKRPSHPLQPELVTKKRRSARDEAEQVSLKEEIDALKPEDLGHYDVTTIFYHEKTLI